MRFLTELNRRNVMRMATLYGVVAWLIMQVAEVVIGLADLPEWIGQATLGVLAIGFPLTLVFAWFYELTPLGLRREQDVDQATPLADAAGRRIDFIVISVLTAAVIVFALDKWWLGVEPDAVPPPPNSIAVLAFANLSDDPNQEYLSDGVAEDLLNLLARIDGLSVISRTSAFSYKGKNVRLSDIARELNVAHVLEGSVRKAGNAVRINAQLVETNSETHLWSATYDQTLDDIFAIQDEIAGEVVDQLKITLRRGPPTVKSIDPDAYALYLRARHLSRQGTPEAWEQAIELFEQALLIAPDHAAAWDGLASTYIQQTNNSERPIDDGYTLAREAASQALALDPDYALGYARLGWIAMHHDGDLAAAARHYERALALGPTDSTILFGAASLAMSLDRIETAIVLENDAILHDPLYPIGHNNRGDTFLSAGEFEKAIGSFRTALTISPEYVGAHYRIGVAFLLKREAESALHEMLQERFRGWRLLGLAMAYHALGRSDESNVALAEMIEDFEHEAAYNISYVFAFRNEADLAFAWLNKAFDYSDPGLAEIVNEPLFGNIKTDPRWQPFLQRIGKSTEQLAAIDFSVTLPD